MGLNVAEKILQDHLADGTLNSGGEIALAIDQTLTQDATGTMAYLQFESMGTDRIKCELAVSYVDHNTIQAGPENADDHAYLKSVARRYGIVFSRPGNGICHQLHLERFGAPGKTLLGSDSHTPTGGGLGMLAIGAGGIDVAAALGGNPYYISSPKIIKVNLKGKTGPWVSAKDIILKVLDIFSTRGNAGCILEYGGSGAGSLDVPERATITNMGAECGVITSVFPSDEITRRFLEAQGRGEAWREITADDDAVYEKVVEIDLSQLEPMAAAPHSPGNVSSVTMLAGARVDQVVIGSCTNSSYRDLKTVAKILEGRKIHEDVELGIAPGSRQVVRMLEREGLMGRLVDAGARILENACGFCIGNSFAPRTEAVSLRTSNRNFEGRSGAASANIYLVSPETAAVSALYGRIVDPRMIEELKCPRVSPPKKFDVDDSMFMLNSEPDDSVEIVKGPGIGEVPRNEPLADEISGSVVIKVGDKITTDHIMPAGPRLKYRSNVEAYSKYVFENVDSQFAERAAQVRDEGKACVIVAGDSYGQGSSREHAALCPMYLGVKVVVAKSFERIHLSNLINFGIAPFIFDRPKDFENIDKGDAVFIGGIADAVANGGTVVMRIEKESGKTFETRLKSVLSARQRKILQAGGLLNMTGSAE